jgi:hypothetical protein
MDKNLNGRGRIETTILQDIKNIQSAGRSRKSARSAFEKKEGRIFSDHALGLRFG